MASNIVNLATRDRQQRALKLEEERSVEMKFALKREDASAVESTLRQLRTIPGMAVEVAELDPHDHLATVANGTLDLYTGELRPHSRGDYSTRLIPIHYDPRALCPTWLEFLGRVLGGNTDMVHYLQRAAGYSLTGSVEEHVLFYLFGKGRNGKGTFLETFYRVAGGPGGYGQRAPFSTFLARRFQNDGPRSDVARLRGARFVHASEANDGQHVDEALVKELTGGDTITARFAYGDYFEFRPTHKLWWSANHLLQVKGTDEGIWSRIHLVPFDVTIPAEERDTQLSAKLQAELPGILTWAVLGAIEWRQMGGLRPPDLVLKANRQYREEMDPLEGFVEACLVRSDGAWTPHRHLYEAYTLHCARTGSDAIPRPEFLRALTSQGIAEHDKRREKPGAVQERGRVGVALKQ